MPSHWNSTIRSNGPTKVFSKAGTNPAIEVTVATGTEFHKNADGAPTLYTPDGHCSLRHLVAMAISNDSNDFDFSDVSIYTVQTPISIERTDYDSRMVCAIIPDDVLTNKKEIKVIADDNRIVTIYLLRTPTKMTRGESFIMDDVTFMVTEDFSWTAKITEMANKSTQDFIEALIEEKKILPVLNSMKLQGASQATLIRKA
ncbi:hypothetical protein CZP2022_54 [Vibrio phage C-ZP2022]|nr:hypothetical protein [Vibrio phage vB_pir03]UKZ10777.1 hypothetical protein CZP2022_54 [Vibrio phage C-ZP2022]